jgi:hypothetical protein
MNVNKKSVAFIVVALLVGIAIGFLSTIVMPLLYRQDVTNKVESLYELANPGVSVEVMNILEESGLYKVLLKSVGPTGTNYAEVYVTKDGKLLTESVVFVERSIAQIEGMKNFVDCLVEKGVKIYGLGNQTATLLQLNILGRYSPKLFVSCDGEFVKRCTDAGVQEVPSVVIGDKIEPGVKTADWFAQQTGCKLKI